jgi:hypothetical protein
MTRKPAPHFGMFMGGIVIADQVQLPVGGDGLIDEAEKLESLLVPMAAPGTGQSQRPRRWPHSARQTV